MYSDTFYSFIYSFTTRLPYSTLALMIYGLINNFRAEKFLRLRSASPTKCGAEFVSKLVQAICLNLSVSYVVES